MKQCNICKQWKDESEFWHDRTKKDGYATSCILCCRKNKPLLPSSSNRNEKGQKLCFTCNTWKDVSEFGNKAKTKDGLNSQCKACVKAYRERNLDRIKAYEEAHREEHKAYMKAYHEVFRQERKIKEQKYYEEHKEEIEQQKEQKRLKAIEDKKRYAHEHREEANARAKKWYRDHLEYCKEYNRQRGQTEKQREYDRQRGQRLDVKLRKTISQGMRHSLKHDKSGQHWETLVPYTLQDLRQHLESQFTPEMNWDNYGSYWEIDHIIPQNTFNITSPEDSDFQICWSLANLRPLEKSLNRQRPKDGSDISENLKYKILKECKELKVSMTLCK